MLQMCARISTQAAQLHQHILRTFCFLYLAVRCCLLLHDSDIHDHRGQVRSNACASDKHNYTTTPWGAVVSAANIHMIHVMRCILVTRGLRPILTRARGLTATWISWRGVLLGAASQQARNACTTWHPCAELAATAAGTLTARSGPEKSRENAASGRGDFESSSKRCRRP